MNAEAMEKTHLLGKRSQKGYAEARRHAFKNDGNTYKCRCPSSYIKKYWKTLMNVLVDIV